MQSTESYMEQQCINKDKRMLRVTTVLIVSSLLLTASLLQMNHSLADKHDITNDNNLSTVHISTTDSRYSLTAHNATFSDVLHELGTTTGFKLKIFEEMYDKRKDWSFHSMPL